MADPRSREPNGSSGNPKTPPAVLAQLKCPSCGREPAIVFPLIRDHHTSVDQAPLVCMDCCLKVRDKH
jgi:hypothetical protein